MDEEEEENQLTAQSDCLNLGMCDEEEKRNFSRRRADGGVEVRWLAWVPVSVVVVSEPMKRC